MPRVGGVFLAVVALVASLLSVSEATAASTWTDAESLYSSSNPNPPIIVRDNNGVSTMIWNAGSPFQMQAYVGSAGSWTRTDLTSSGTNQIYTLSLGLKGDAIAIWSNSSGLNTLLQTRTKLAGGGWGPLETIANSADYGGYSDVVGDTNGNQTAVEYRGTQLVSYTKLAGQSWSGPTTIGPVGYIPYLAVDNSGTVHLMISKAVGSLTQIFYSYKPFGGSWTTMEQVTSSVNGTRDPEIFSDLEGNLTVLYSLGGQLASVSKPAGGSWQSEQVIPGATVNARGQYLDNQGTLHVAWFKSGAIRYSQLPRGGSWAPETVAATTSSVSYYPAVSADTNGNITVAWANGKVVYGAVKEAGSSSWGTNSTLYNLDTTNSAGVVSLATSNDGKAVAAWDQGNRILTATVTNPMLRAPTFSTPVQTEDGFTVNVTNYDAAWAWTPSASAGAIVTAGTASGSTLPLTVTGLSPGASSTLTMTNSRSGYTNGTATVSSAALNVALSPEVNIPTRNATGFSTEITNYDPSWTWVATTDAGSASIVSSGGSHLLSVTGLAAGQTASVTLTASRTGYLTGTSYVLDSALQAAHNPSFDSAVRTADGFEVDVTNYDANYTWSHAVDYGNIAFAVSSGSTLSFIVNGLSPGQSGTLTVDTTRSGYADGQSSVLGSALSAALTPTFGSVTRTAHGYTFDVQNYDASWNWSVSASAGTVVLGTPSGSTVPVTVTNLGNNQSATVTVSTSRSAYASGSATKTGIALAAALTPVLSAPTKTSTGYIVSVTNYDPSWTWSTSATAGTVSQGTASGSSWQLTVSGLTAGQAADLTIDTSRSGYVSGSTTVTSNALSAARTPTFDTPVRTATGYTVNITNYDPGWTWTPSASTGSVTVGSASGSTLPLTVTGVASSASSTVSVDATRAGYLTGTATVSGTALGAALVPTFDTPVATADGFTVNLTNYNASWTWSYVASSGTLVTGTPSSSSVALTVSGLTPGSTASITVDTTRSGYGAGQQVLDGATRGAQNPVASLVLSAAIGQNMSGSTVSVSATGLQSSAPYSVTVYSTPRTLGSGTATAGLVTTSFVIPSGLEEGWHRMVFTSTAFSGSELEETLYFKVSSAGALLATSTTAPVSLATTGNVTLFSGGLIVVLSLGLGLALIRARRRLTSSQH